MKLGKALAWTFGSVAAAAALVVGFGQVNEQKISECSPHDTHMTALVVKWRLTGGYGLGILNADNRIVYAENNDRPEPLQEKAAHFCATRQLTAGP